MENTGNIIKVIKEPFLGEDNKYHFVYKTTCLINQKEYTGKHTTKKINDNYLGSGKYLQNAINKYGAENFKREIIGFFNTAKEAYEFENLIVTKEYTNRKDTYNIALGGRGFDLLKNRDSEAFSKTMSIIAKKYWDSLTPEQKKERNKNFKFDATGIKRSEEFKQNASKRLIGHEVSPETRKKISEAKIGKSVNKGIKRTPEQCKAQSERLKGIAFTKGMVALHKNGVIKKAYPNSEKYAELIKEGFKLGTGLKTFGAKNYIWLKNKDTNQSFRVEPESERYFELIKQGFVKGRYAPWNKKN